jgi:hypothetical protein
LTDCPSPRERLGYIARYAGGRRKGQSAAMANRNLTSNELARANELLAKVRKKLTELAGGDPLLLFAYRRKVRKELTYDERGKPAERQKLKHVKWGLQNGRCAHCGKEMPLKYSELDRKNAFDGYTKENTELIHAECHHERQAAKGYT